MLAGSLDDDCVPCFKGSTKPPPIPLLLPVHFEAIISDDETSITFELNYSDLVADSLFAHIHLGQKGVAGGVMIFFCDNSNPPHSPRSCPTGGGTVMGTVTAADADRLDGQGIAPGEFSKVIEAIRSGVTYVNVHSVKFPPGEIRGQVRVVNRNDDNTGIDC